MRTDRQRVDDTLIGLKNEYNFAIALGTICCQSCTWAEIEGHAGDTRDVAFYHQQDAASFDEHDMLQDMLFIAHKGRVRLLVDALQDAGFVVEWNGNVNTRVGIVIANEEEHDES